ncbi:hypothetical protein IWZ01DRAFT_497461 [Phyllosticta capitalensis]
MLLRQRMPLHERLGCLMTEAAERVRRAARLRLCLGGVGAEGSVMRVQRRMRESGFCAQLHHVVSSLSTTLASSSPSSALSLLLHDHASTLPRTHFRAPKPPPCPSNPLSLTPATPTTVPTKPHAISNTTYASSARIHLRGLAVPVVSAMRMASKKTELASCVAAALAGETVCVMWLESHCR